MNAIEIVAIVGALTESATRLLMLARAQGANVDDLLAEYDRIHARVMAYQPLPPPESP